MDRNNTIDFICRISGKSNAFDELEKRLLDVDDSKIPQLLLECGVLPELFVHDSSEEKLWAKYSD
ncbi:MAG: HindIII family type II restriction endonuclease, partial [Thermoguttaceae bacterium]